MREALAEISVASGDRLIKPEKRRENETGTPEMSSKSLVSLARLAVDTGGRFTERTNDVTLGYARARHDLGCVYSLGFRDPDSRSGRVRNVRVRVLRPGLRAVHPSLYVFRSEDEREESFVRAAFVSPGQSDAGVVRAHLFPLRPGSKRRWEGLIALSFPVPPAGMIEGTVQRDFGAVLSKGPSVAHSFNRRISLQPSDPAAPDAPQVVFLEPVSLGPGEYTLTVVVSDPRDRGTESTRIDLALPRVPRGEPFLVGPILGRAASANLVLTGGGEATRDDRVGGNESFEPLLVRQVDGSEDLVALTQVCIVGSPQEGGAGPAVIERSLLEARGAKVGTLPDVRLKLDDEGAVACQNLLDLLPVSTLRSGEYVFEVALRRAAGETGSRQRVAFAVN